MSNARLLTVVLFLAPAALATSVSTPTTTQPAGTTPAKPERPKGKIVLKAKIGMAGAADWEAFGEIRKRKDNFR